MFKFIKNLFKQNSLIFNQIEKKTDYLMYAPYILSNLHQVTSGLLMYNEDKTVHNFNDMIEKDLYSSIELFWHYVILQYDIDIFILEYNGKPLGYAMMEQDPLLRYFFIDESIRNQNFGSSFIQFLNQLYGSFKIKIEEDEYNTGLYHFYEKNGFNFLKKSFTNSKIYYEYCL